MNRQVTARQAWTATVIAILDLIALTFISASTPKVAVLAAFAGCEGVLIILAVATWKKYFEQLIDEKTKPNEG